MSILSDGGTKTYKRLLQKSGLGGDDSDDEDEAVGGADADENTGLLSGQGPVAVRHNGEDERFGRRDSRSRSQSVRRKTKWYKRPSPMWSVWSSSLQSGVTR